MKNRLTLSTDYYKTRQRIRAPKLREEKLLDIIENMDQLESGLEACNIGIPVNDSSHVSDYQTDLDHCVAMNKGSMILTSEESDDTKHFDVKECTTELLLESKQTFSDKKRSPLSEHASKSPRVVQTMCAHAQDNSHQMSESDATYKGCSRALQPNILKQNQCFSLQRQQPNKKLPTKLQTCLVSSRTPKSKPKTTVATAPAFRSSERALKRKEFNAKLEEKHQALAEEKTRSEARTKDEMIAAIKELRKNLIFKANPLPTFYVEGIPPKSELKKLPVTQARSPKLGRRKCEETAAM